MLQCFLIIHQHKKLYIEWFCHTFNNYRKFEVCSEIFNVFLTMLLACVVTSSVSVWRGDGVRNPCMNRNYSYNSFRLRRNNFMTVLIKREMAIMSAQNSLLVLTRNASRVYMKCFPVLFQNFVCFCQEARRKYSSKSQYLKYYAVLGIPSSSDQEGVRVAFLNLVKKYHPDSDSSEANKEKFLEIETAYRKLQEKFAEERWGVDEGIGEYGLYYKDKNDNNNFDIKHTAPQHRHYLSYDGYGIGNQQQREKQYQKKRAMTAIHNVYNHRLSKIPHGEEQSLVVKDTKEAKKIKIRSEMERLVEDLIQESMARGDFDNLSGSGKPLKRQNTNPYVDFVTQKMNEVLIDNGFTPEWITLQKDISREMSNLRDLLAHKRTLLGHEPLSAEELVLWKQELKGMQVQVQQLNNKINSFNLQVPLLDKQMVFFQLEREAAKILKDGKTKFDVPIESKSTETDNTSKNEMTFTGLLEILLFKKY